VAARNGADPTGNPTLYDAIQKAKKNSVPNDNIDRAVKRGSGQEAGGADWQTIMYEGYGPNGVALLIECLTDNRNRAAAEVRTALTRNGGNLADPGSVSYCSIRKGQVCVPKAGLSEDDVLLAVLDAGAEECNDLGESFEVISEPADLVPVRKALQDAGIDYESAESTFVPTVQCRSTRTAPARSSGSSTRSTTATTCRTSSPTSTSPTRSSPSSMHNRTDCVCLWYCFGMTQEMVTTSLKLPADIYQAIKEEAADDHRSINAAIIVALTEHCAQSPAGPSSRRRRRSNR
jgi:YebC/PmpR family DNA-binding regulatory protein